jgi:hypothetical protein
MDSFHRFPTLLFLVDATGMQLPIWRFSTSRPSLTPKTQNYKEGKQNK